MQVAGSRSWRSTFDVPEAPHIALFIRDALRLDRAENAPPQLEGQIPDRASLINDRDRAASLWRSWWRTLMPAGPLDADLSPLSNDELGGALRALRPEARAWFDEHRKPQIQPQRDSMRDWKITRDAVESAATELEVEPHTLHADAWLLLVEGEWWHRPAPGQLIYSPAIREDEEQFRELLRSTFQSSL
jgi:hypothetical protein